MLSCVDRSTMQEPGKIMKITVCELPDDRAAFSSAWEALMVHVRREASELLLLPEIPFCPWFAGSRHFDPAVWQQAIAAHNDWELRLHEAAPPLGGGAPAVGWGNEGPHDAR